MKRISLLCLASALFLCSCNPHSPLPQPSSNHQYDSSSPIPSSEPTLSSSIERMASSGLTYELNASQNGYIVKDKGECIDKTIVIPDKYQDLPVVEIAKDAFKNDTEIESFISGKNIKKIGSEAFSSCVSLTSVTLNEGIETIEDEAFYWCHSLVDINLPNSLTSIGQLVFFDSGLYQNTANYVDGALIIDHWICYAQSVKGDFIVPDDVYGLSEKVFNNCGKLTSIDVPLSVTRYGNAPLFDFSDALTSIKISKNVNLGSYVSSRFTVNNEFTESGRIHYVRRS